MPISPPSSAQDTETTDRAAGERFVRGSDGKVQAPIAPQCISTKHRPWSPPPGQVGHPRFRCRSRRSVDRLTRCPNPVTMNVEARAVLLIIYSTRKKKRPEGLSDKEATNRAIEKTIKTKATKRENKKEGNEQNKCLVSSRQKIPFFVLCPSTPLAGWRGWSCHTRRQGADRRPTPPFVLFCCCGPILLSLLAGVFPPTRAPSLSLPRALFVVYSWLRLLETLHIAPA